MRVLLLRSNPVDPDSRVEKEAESLMKAGIIVDIFCWDRGSNHSIVKNLKSINNTQCDIYRFGFKSIYGAGFKRNLKPLLQFQKAIKYYINEYHEKYDVIHACDFDTAFTAHRLAKKYNIKFIYDIFDYYADAFNVPETFKKTIICLDTKIVNDSDGVIICSEQRKEQLRNAKPKRLVIIHNSPKMLDLVDSQENRKNANTLKIGYIGILNDGRMIPEMLKAVSESKNYELLIGGFGKYESLVKEYANKYDNILFYGRVPYQKTLSIEESCDVLTAIYDPTIPNHKYAAPNKFYEALMLGKPLIMCRNTGMADIVEANQFGTLVDYNFESLKAGLQRVLENLETFRNNSKMEQDIFSKKYSWNIMEKRLINLYNEVGKES